MRLFLTGVGGFIGFHLAKTLLKEGVEIFGIDNLNDYYDPRHKVVRLEQLREYGNFTFKKCDLLDLASLRKAWLEFSPDHVMHLAAQAGVRYSLENPMAYIQSNIVGFQHMIDLARETKPLNFVYASSSSVYGSNKEIPFSEKQDVSNPISLYAASKKSNELVAHCYSHLFELPTTGLRFFTVYGTHSRPDMALYKFADAIARDKPIQIFNHGNMKRDFTYVDDIVDGCIRSLKKPLQAAVYNLGRGQPVDLLRMVELLEENLGRTAKKEFLPLQAGDVPVTTADVSLARKQIGYEPKTSLDVGIQHFCKWFDGHQTQLSTVTL